MKFKRNRTKSDKGMTRISSSENKSRQDTEPNKIEWTENVIPVKRTFPGPEYASVHLRIAFDREAFAEATAHVFESIHEEVCGVLVGDVCEDNEGTFVHVGTIIRGSSTLQGNTHVTFTQETWSHIHQEIDEKYPNSQILGWYHSHPGFGVIFSEKDLFIQENFFPSSTQFALVMDPLGGERAICINTNTGIQYVEKFWVDSRELKTQRSVYSESKIFKNTQTDNTSHDQIDEKIGILDLRLTQIMRILEKQESSISRPVIAMLSFLLVAILFITFRTGEIPQNSNNRNIAPPKLIQYMPVAIKLGEKDAVIGIVKWEIPPQLISYLNAPIKITEINYQKIKRELNNWIQSIIGVLIKYGNIILEPMSFFLNTNSPIPNHINTTYSLDYQGKTQIPSNKRRAS